MTVFMFKYVKDNFITYSLWNVNLDYHTILIVSRLQSVHKLNSMTSKFQIALQNVEKFRFRNKKFATTFANGLFFELLEKLFLIFLTIFYRIF